MGNTVKYNSKNIVNIRLPIQNGIGPILLLCFIETVKKVGFLKSALISENEKIISPTIHSSNNNKCKKKCYICGIIISKTIFE